MLAWLPQNLENLEKFIFFKKIINSQEKSGDAVEKHTSNFWATLASQHSCSKMSVAAKGGALNAFNPLKSSWLALSL